MKKLTLLLLLATLGVLASCAATIPAELADARIAFKRAASGDASQLAPAELHIASTALKQAEKSFDADGASFKTRDLAYVAQRKAQLAEATASIAMERKSQAASQQTFESTQTEIVAKSKRDLETSQSALAQSELSGALTADQLALEQQARIAAEKRAAAAMLALAELAAVKEEERGVVITLSGSVLFTSAKWTLSPEAQTRLSAVAAVLLENPKRKLVIEGHTDSQGTDQDNLVLSQHRAEAVRTYLVQRGYDPSHIIARGIGEAVPVANNDSTEGRANNRRVEIIIQREVTASR